MKKNILILFSLLLVTACGSSENKDEASAEVKTTIEERIVPVEVMVVQRGRIAQNIPLTGVLQPLHEVDIIAEVSGKVVNINKKLGEKVSRRDTLARIDDRIPLSQFRQAESQVLSAETNVQIAELNLQSDEELYNNQDISKLAYQNSVLALKTAKANHMSALANLSTMKKQFQDTRLTSPIDGYISRKYINLGTMVNPGTAVYRVVDLNTLKVEVGIPQALISRVGMGSRVRVTISALQNRMFPGKVEYVSPQADETTGAFTAEIHIKNNKDLEIRAGMTARLALQLEEKDGQLVVPDYAIVKKNGDNYVYLVKENVARLAMVDIAETIGSNAIVSDGLAEGDKVVVVGMKNLGIETRVSIETEN